MTNPLGYLKSLYLFLTASLESRFPSLSTRRGISQPLIIGIIIAIIIIGGVAVYIVVTSSGTTTTTTIPYP